MRLLAKLGCFSRSIFRAAEEEVGKLCSAHVLFGDGGELGCEKKFGHLGSVASPE